MRTAEETRAAILDAARARFGRDGYAGTTLRAVTADVGVTAAMAIRYFGSKQALFAEAADVILDLPDLTDVPGDEIAAVLLPRFFTVWEDEGTFLALMRSAVTSEEAAEAMRRVFAAQVLPVFSTATPDHARERAGLVGSFLLGLALTRYVLGTPAVATLTREQVIAWAGPVLSQLLTGPAPAGKSA